jgi:hypothetical protein
MKKISIFFTILFLTTLFSCQFAPYAHIYTTEKPNEADLIGEYSFQFQTVDTLNISLNSKLRDSIIIPKIQINGDGTYNVKDLPVFEFHLPTEFKDLISETGKWNVIADKIFDGDGNITGYFYKIELNGLPFEVKKVGLMNNKPPHKLIFGFGDPDQGHVMVFEK